MKKVLMLSTAILAASISISQAQDSGPNWNYMEAGYGMLNVDDTDIGFKGFALKGSTELNDLLFVTGSYSRAMDDAELNSSTAIFTVGGGLKTSASKSIDVYVGMNYYKSDTIADGYAASLHGYDINAGIKSVVGEKLLVDLGAAYGKIFDKGDLVFENVFSLSASTVYMVTDAWGVGLETVYSADQQSYSMKARYLF